MWPPSQPPGEARYAAVRGGLRPGASVRASLSDQCRSRYKPGLEEEALQSASPQIGIVMGSTSDWPTLEHAAKTLETLDVRFETRVVSAHRTPDLLFEYAGTAVSRGLQAIIAGAGGAAHLPGMLAAKTRIPVLGVPVESKALSGIDSLLSIAQMPAGIPVGTLAIGRAGAINAALLAAAMLATQDAALAGRLDAYREAQTERVLATPDPAAAETSK